MNSLPPTGNTQGRSSLWLGLSLVLFLAAATPAAHAGSVIAWGNNNDSQIQVPANLTNITAVAGGRLHSLALRADGTVAAWGFNLFGQANVPAGLDEVVAIAARYSESIALKSDGTVASWGQTTAPAGLTDVVAITAGWNHSLALREDGSLVAWGDQTEVPSGLTSVRAIAAGHGHNLALRTDGTVFAWGDDSFEKTTVPAGLTNVVAIAAGKDHSLALRSDGTVVAWGDDSRGQVSVPAALAEVVAISAGAQHSLALRANGTVTAWGDNTFTQAQPPSGGNFFAIAAGGYHNLAVRGGGAPIILQQPASQTVSLTGTAVFRVSAVGLQPLSFQWLRDGENIAEANDSVLVLEDVDETDAGVYSVRVSNAVGSVTSAEAVLTAVAAPPAIGLQPQSQTVVCGENVRLEVAVSGVQPFSYQWWHGDEIVSTDSSLVLNSVIKADAGEYFVVISNENGSVTSEVAELEVVAVRPTITSPLAATGRQGEEFNYAIMAEPVATAFSAILPAGLAIDPATGIIAGIPEQAGTFGARITAITPCDSQTATVAITIEPATVPEITSPLIVEGEEGVLFTYQIEATGSPTRFSAQDLPPGLVLDPVTGLISGRPMFAGEFSSTIFASTDWTSGAATLEFDFSPAVIVSLSIVDVTSRYLTPYLLEFEFSLRSGQPGNGDPGNGDNGDPGNGDNGDPGNGDNGDPGNGDNGDPGNGDNGDPGNGDNGDPDAGGLGLGSPLVVAASLLGVVPMENEQAISPTETGFFLTRGTRISGDQTKIHLVLDFSRSVTSVPGAVEAMVQGAQIFVSRQRPGTLIGVYQFHREDQEPQQVMPLTDDKELVKDALGRIWDDYVRGFSAGSRCWDALAAAIDDLGPAGPDERHYVVFISDGADESSLATLEDVTAAAEADNVRVYPIGFGPELENEPLMSIAGATQGLYFEAVSPEELIQGFEHASTDLVDNRYILRWATLRRSGEFDPSFAITYQDITATSPDSAFPLYAPADYAGPVTAGMLELVADEAEPGTVILHASYVPRNIQRIRIRYRANWPVQVTLESTGLEGILRDWSLSETDDGQGGRWLEITGPSPQAPLPFVAFGDMVSFSFRDMPDASEMFSLVTVDNTIYETGGGQSFVIQGAGAFTQEYPVLPFGTPVPWLIAHGITADFEAAEISDLDGSGMPAWKQYLANTDPTNPESTFLVRSIFVDIFGRPHITFATAMSRTYRVESSTDFNNWEVVSDNIAGTGGDVTVMDPRFMPDVPKLLYRVAVY